MTSRDVLRLYQQMGVRPPADLSAARISKYRATKKELAGHLFDSALEARAYQVLKLWEAAGAITGLELQPSFILQQKFIRDGRTIREMKYTADFQFVRDGRIVVVEAKGHRTQPYLLRRKLFLAKYPELAFEEWNHAKVLEMAQI